MAEEQFLAVAVDAAKNAGEIIRNGFYTTKNVEHKGQVDLVTETDKACEDLIFNHLRKHFPGHKFIGEETSAALGATADLTDEPTWIVDPLDGTTNFVHGFPFVCVSIGLTISKVPTVGVVYNPIMNELFTAVRGKGAFLNGSPIKASSQDELVKALLVTEAGTKRDKATVDDTTNQINKPKSAGPSEKEEEKKSSGFSVRQLSRGDDREGRGREPSRRRRGTNRRRCCCRRRSLTLEEEEHKEGARKKGEFGMAGEDHVVVDVDGLASAKSDGATEKPSEAVSCPVVAAAAVGSAEEGSGEDEPLIQAAECRICQEEDSVKNLEKPCACNGSLKYAHRACVQRWCNEKGDTTCEICHEEYKPGYTAPPRVQPDETAIDISDELIMNLRDPRLLAVAAAQRRLLEADYDNYGGSDAGGAAFCRSAALILMALLLLRHALSISDNEGNDDDSSTMFSLFLLRAAGFLLPCYIMAWIFSVLHRRRQRQEEAAMAAAEVTFILESARGRALQFAITPDSPATPQREPSPQ